MIAVIAERREETVASCRQYGVRRLERFGSEVTGSSDPVTSDFDFLAGYPDDYAYGLWHTRFFASKDDPRSLPGGAPADLVKSDTRNARAFRAPVDVSEMNRDGQPVANLAR